VPTTIGVKGIPVKVAFAPDHAPELELMKQLLTVRADGQQAELEGGQIWFAIFTFNGSSGIDDTLLALARGRVKDPWRPRSWPGTPEVGVAALAEA
jgi:hypothetical protein